jgi:hypothetical protein
VPADRVIIVHLRRPTSNSDEKRSDPFWEFGSFGITGCHSSNLMNRKNVGKLNGVRFAFAQGGNKGTRLVYLTPPVKIVDHGDVIEATWSPQWPFRYVDAPILVSNREVSKFPKLETSVLKGGVRSTKEGQFSSCFRSRTTCLPDEIAKEVISVYTQQRNRANISAIARSYEEALPWLPPQLDRDRSRTYDQKIEIARKSKSRSGCGVSARTSPHNPRRAARSRKAC